MEARDQNNVTVLPTAKAQLPAQFDLEALLSALQSDPQLMQGLAAYITGQHEQETVDTSHCSNSSELVEYYFKIHDITATMEGFEQNGKRVLDTTVKNQLEQWCQKNNVAIVYGQKEC